MSPFRNGTGSRKMMASKTMLIIELENRNAFRSMHVPGRVGFHPFAMGLHMKMQIMAAVMPKMVTAAIRIYTTNRYL